MNNISIPLSSGRSLPTFCLREIDLPEVTQWEIGGQYYVVAKVEMVAKMAAKAFGMENSNDGGKLEAEFKMLSVKKLGAAESSALEKKAFESFSARVKSGEEKYENK